MSFCSLIKGIAPKICRLCFVLVNSILLNLLLCVWILFLHNHVANVWLSAPVLWVLCYTKSGHKSFEDKSCTWHQPCTNQRALSVHHFGKYKKTVLHTRIVTHSESQERSESVRKQRLLVVVMHVFFFFLSSFLFLFFSSSFSSTRTINKLFFFLFFFFLIRLSSCSSFFTSHLFPTFSTARTSYATNFVFSGLFLLVFLQHENKQIWQFQCRLNRILDWVCRSVILLDGANISLVTLSVRSR